jgi:Protein of unknown function (DUF3224)
MRSHQLQQTSQSEVSVTKYERQILSEADESGVTLLSTRLEETFTGGLIGKGVALHVRTVYADKSDTFTGIERFNGSLEGRSGTFSLTAKGYTTPAGVVHGTWEVVPRSATGELKGLRGHGVFSAINDHTQPHAIDSLTYWFE